MNKPLAPVQAYSLLHPNPVTATVIDGSYATVVFADRPGYIDLAVVQAAEAAGLITITEVGGNPLAETYGRVRVLYTIN